MLRKLKSRFMMLGMVLAVALMLSGCELDLAALLEGPYSEGESVVAQTVEDSTEAISAEAANPEVTADAEENEDSAETGDGDGVNASVSEEVSAESEAEEETVEDDAEAILDPEEYYYDVENVVLYLELYHELPYNYITKKEAEKMGWQGGSVEDYMPDAAIGGDHFGNFEGKLPKRNDYFECDIDTHGYKNRGSRRLIYTLDGKYYYTKDHYENFREVTVDESYQVTIH